MDEEICQAQYLLPREYLLQYQKEITNRQQPITKEEITNRQQPITKERGIHTQDIISIILL
jgi:hypothetical protein